jgi:hypothetical protein
MASASSHQIPDLVSDAFGEALILLIQWRGGADEPVVILDGKPIRISLLFDLVVGQKYTDQLPRSIQELLLTYAGRDPKRQSQLAELTLLPTYEVAAQCLLRWVGQKKSGLSR